MSRSTISISFKISDDEKGFKTLAMDAASLKGIMKEIVIEGQKLEKSVFGLAAASTIISSFSNAAQQLQGVLSNLTSESGAFTKSMKAANTMAGKDAAGFKALKKDVADLSKEIPIARDELANGLYQVISNGVPEDNWIEYLKTSARSAVGGIADLGQTVTVTSTIIKNYGLAWDVAQEIQDKIQLTAKNGVTSFEQLAQALPRVAGNAATLGVSVDELMASFATLTGVSGNTAEVSTQLAAIFTALVKPSSEATKMAEAMGIQFDAASIKASGGLMKFLQSLDQSVKKYAQASGVLEQEVYGKLFGSAESLRALIPLTGELSNKFSENVGAMAGSAGTMDAAFEEMSSTGEATTQMLQNQMAKLSDFIAAWTAPIQPLINVGVTAISSAASLAILLTSIKAVSVGQVVLAAKTKLTNLVFSTASLISQKYARAMNIVALSENGATRATIAFRAALRGLMIATGVGIAIAAVTTAIMYMTSATDEATESTNKLLSAEERAKRDAEQLEQLRQQEASTLTQTRATLEMNINRLKEFNGTKEQEKKLVNEMNDTYGETMGYFSNVADWYNTLISNSEAYCRQMVTEARTRMLANQIAQKEQETHDIVYDDSGNKRLYSKKRKTETYSIGTYSSNFGVGNYTGTREIEGSSDWEKANAAIKQNEAEVANLRKQMKDAAKEAATLSLPVKGSSTRPNRPDSTTAATGRTKAPRSTSSTTTEKPKQTEVNESASTLKEINDNIDFLQGKLQNSALENAAAINKEIAQWEKKADAIRNAGKAVEEAPKYTPAPVTDIKTIQEATDAISYYDEKIRLANDEERTGLVKVRAEYEKLLESLNRPITAQGIQDMLDSLKGLTREEYVIKIQAIGLDAIEDYIKQIEKMLSDPNLPEGMTKWLSSMKTDLSGISKDKSFSKLSKKAEQAYSAVGDLGGAFKNLGGEIGAPILDIAGTMMQAIATMVLSYSKAMEGSTAMGPWGWIAFAATGLATLTSVVASVKSLPKFAEGGVISGPTVGLMGEYAGAANNPEVVAPLNKLKDLLQPEGVSAMGGKVVFEISGRNLRGVLQRVDKLSSRS